MNQIHNVQCQIVPNHVSDEEFEQKPDDDDGPHRQTPRHDKTDNHCHGIAYRINDAVSRVALRERLFSLVIDYHRRVFDDFPRGLDAYREKQPLPHLHPRKEIPKA